MVAHIPHEELRFRIHAEWKLRFAHIRRLDNCRANEDACLPQLVCGMPISGCKQRPPGSRIERHVRNSARYLFARIEHHLQTMKRNVAPRGLFYRESTNIRMINSTAVNLTIAETSIVLDDSQHPQPIDGWVIVARWPDGKSEQLIGVFTERHFAESWIKYQSPLWLCQKEAELE